MKTLKWTIPLAILVFLGLLLLEKNMRDAYSSINDDVFVFVRYAALASLVYINYKLYARDKIRDKNKSEIEEFLNDK